MKYRRGFTVIESVAMMLTISVLVLILGAIMRQKKIWPFDRLDVWLDSRKKVETTTR